MSFWVRRALLVMLSMVYVAVSVVPAWHALQGNQHAKDWASYHYAVKVLAAGGEPYALSALEQAAVADSFGQTVYPFLYPPPFLLSVWWMAPLTADWSRDLFFVINQLAWPGLLVVLWCWFRANPIALAIIAITLTPITHAGRLGQVNGVVALLVTLALWRRGGVLLSLAAMIKMSPALYLPVWMAQRHWKGVCAAVLGAVGLSVLALCVVPLSSQLVFYQELLPGFSSGGYNGLSVPISLPANHSIPSALDALWPGPDEHTLSPSVRRVVSGLLLGGLAVAAWGSRRKLDVLAEANLLGAVTVWLVVLPVFAYEHHLSLLVLPVAALATALLDHRLPRWAWGPALLGYAGVAWPLAGFRQALRQAPQWAGWIQESKLLAALLLMALCAWVVVRSGGAVLAEASEGES